MKALYKIDNSTPYAKLNFNNNKYYLFNNSWGSSGISGWWQTVYHNSNTNFGYVWNWPTTTGGVKAFPSIVSGWHWTEGYTPGSGLPTRLSDNKAINSGVTYSIDPATNGQYNNAYDIWLHTTGTATWSSTPTDNFTINVKNFTDYLVGKSYFPTTRYVSSIEYGTEITNGSGQLNYSNFYANVQ
ncbi:hypothetical protein [Paenibacillus sp. Leaf72]|uniref:hypothetical protein n=1 Tax=Paenibacillus sp. Leaf72 TaxID=1736234 RepID=UPI0006F3DB7D|nr:hypothetical protein [Paenibacillus sp. Leaf72]KQO18237.1 hypothetical protein ASF12_06280 [Paenibacillus sp. Leaf72]